MSVGLPVALAIFLASALVVIYLGNLLAKYGDALATLTGWGRLFVGSILVALATSLPELSTNISAVRLDPPNPELALGNVMGANMVNMFMLAVVALFFGGKRFLQQVAPEQGYLIPSGGHYDRPGPTVRRGKNGASLGANRLVFCDSAGWYTFLVCGWSTSSAPRKPRWIKQRIPRV